MFNIKPAQVTAAAVLDNEPRPGREQLLAAARIFGGAAKALPGWQTRLRDQYTGNEAAADDMAAALRKYGRYASEKQRAFAQSLVERAGRLNAPAVLPGAIVAPTGGSLRVPDLFAVMQKHADFYVGAVTLSRRNQDSLVWIKREGVEKVVGRIENGIATIFRGRMNEEMNLHMLALLAELEANPLAAAMKYGRLSGRCCSCGRDLTDPESIERGIGPGCATKFA